MNGHDFLKTHPWLGEPNRHEWTDKATGLHCLILRHREGHLCGYVQELPVVPDFAEVHGGITGGDAGWIGFDCAHEGDYQPYAHDQTGAVYRDFAYVKKECEKLALIVLRSQTWATRIRLWWEGWWRDWE